MDKDLAKSLVELIDETIAEIEELKKSKLDNCQVNVELKGPGEDGIDGHKASGSLEAKKAEDEAEEKKKKEEEAKKAEVAKGVLDEADPKKVGAEVKKEEDKAEDEDDEDEEAEEGKKPAFMKSEEEVNTLMKSMIDDRVKPLESKMDSLITLIKELADAPVAPKGITFDNIKPLTKSEGETQPLSKAEVASKLFELKKSGTKVDSNDITQAELGNESTLNRLVQKYGIK